MRRGNPLTSAGAGLCHEVVVEICALEGPDRIRELIARNVAQALDRRLAGRAVAAPAQRREPRRDLAGPVREPPAARRQHGPGV